MLDADWATGCAPAVAAWTVWVAAWTAPLTVAVTAEAGCGTAGLVLLAAGAAGAGWDPPATVWTIWAAAWTTPLTAAAAGASAGAVDEGACVP